MIKNILQLQIKTLTAFALVKLRIYPKIDLVIYFLFQTVISSMYCISPQYTAFLHLLSLPAYALNAARHHRSTFHAHSYQISSTLYAVFGFEFKGAKCLNPSPCTLRLKVVTVRVVKMKMKFLNQFYIYIDCK